MKEFHPVTFSKRPIYLGLISFFLLLFLTQFLTYQRYLIDKDVENEDLHRVLISVKDRLQSTLSNSLSSTRTLAFIVKKYGVPQDFDSIAMDILESNNYIDALQLTREGVITHVYPMSGNESVIGFDILNDTLANKEAYRAIKRKELFFAGPLELKQGGTAVVGRLPIFINDSFWGFSAVLIKLSNLLAAAGIDTLQDERYTYQLSKRNLTTGKEEFFLTSNHSFDKGEVSSVVVPHGEWKIYVAVKDHPLTFPYRFAIVGLLLSILGGLFTWNLVRQPEKLKQLVEEKTAQLSVSRSNYQSTLERVTDGFIAYDRDWRYTYINRRASEALDINADELIGRKIWDEFPHLAHQPIYAAHIEAVSKQRYVFIESYLPEKQKWFENHLYPSSDGLSVFFRDITENKTAKDTLEASERYFRALIEKSTDAVVLLDFNGKPMYQSPSTERISGYSFPEIQALNGLDLIHPEDQGEEAAIFTRLVQSPGMIVKRYFRFKHKHGRYIWLEGTFTNLLDDKNVNAIVFNYHDITERVEAEKLAAKASSVYYVISRINRMIIHVKDETTLFTQACQIAIDSQKFKMAWVGLFDEKEKKIIPFIHAGDGPGYLSVVNNIAVEDERNASDPTCLAFRHNKSIVCNDIQHDISMRPWVREALVLGYRSSIAIPIAKMGTTVGVFTLYNSTPDYFDAQEIGLLEEVSGDISFTLENIEKEKLRAKAEKQIIKTNHEKETTLNRISDSVFSLDADWRYTFLNEAALATHPMGREAVLGKTIWEVHPDVIGTLFEEKYREAKRLNMATEVSTYYAPMDKWFNAKAYPSDDGLTVYYQDVTERKKVEEQIEAEKIFTDTILDSLPGIFYLYNKDGRFRRWNKNFEIISEFSGEEIINMHALDFFDADDKQLMQKKIETVFATGKAEAMAQFYTRSKRKMPYYFTGRRLNYKGSHYLMGIGIDITERIEAEKAEAKLQQRFKAIFDATSDAILLADDAGNYIQVNPAAAKMLGYSEDELLTKSAAQIVSSNNTIGLWSTFLDDRRQVGTIELIRKDGAAVICDYNAVSAILPGVHLSVLTDITEKVLSQERLRKSETRLKEAQEIAKVGNWETELSDMSVIWSDETFRIFEVDPNRFKPSHSDFLGFVHAEDRANVDAVFIASLSKKALSSIEHRIITATGKLKFIEERWQIFCDEAGSPLRVSGTCQDISERKFVEEEIIRTKSRLDAIVENTSDLIWSIDSEYRLLFCNTRFSVFVQALTGGQIDIDDDVRRFIPDSYVTDLISLCDRALKGEQFSAERVRNFNDRDATIEYFFNPIWNERSEVIGLSCFMRDITDRKRAENALNESRRKYQYLFQNNPAPMFIWEFATKKIIDCNDEVLQKYGYTKEEFLGLTILDIRPEEDIPKIKEATITPEVYGNVHKKIWKHKKKDGELMDVEINGHLMEYQGKKVSFVQVNDISEKVKAEAEINSYYQKLHELTAHLQYIREDERTRIAREIHDELGQQLTGLKMDASWIYKKFVAADKPILDKLLSMIALIDDTVKTVRRIASDLRPGILDDLGLIPALEWQAQEFEKRTGVKSDFSNFVADFNPERNLAINIFRIYQEALTNVTRYAQATLINTVLEENEGYFILLMSDNGCGFDLDEVRKKKSWGIVGMRERALLFKGELVIRSEKSRGTTIKLSIPMST